MRAKNIHVFYTPKQVRAVDASRNFSKSPLKPKLLLEHLEQNGLMDHFTVSGDFRPFSNNEFVIAHKRGYVERFFAGQRPGCESNGLEWSEQFAQSVRYTNASLHAAIENAILHPEEVSFSPTSGFHHAHPGAGSGFCTFSGQVLAAVKVWRKHGKVGAFVDLDGHYGNSIEDTREYQPDINHAVPRGFNFNPAGAGDSYVNNVHDYLHNILGPAILAGNIDYVVWCHGVDSHEDDDLHGQCTTAQWTACSRIFWKWVKKMDELLGRPLPVACSLFGGYRKDDYNSVLSLHAYDLVTCIRILLETPVEYKLKVVDKPGYWPQPTPQSLFKNEYVGSSNLKERRRRLDEQERTMRLQRERLNEQESELDRLFRLRGGRF